MGILFSCLILIFLIYVLTHTIDFDKKFNKKNASKLIRRISFIVIPLFFVLKVAFILNEVNYMTNLTTKDVSRIEIIRYSRQYNVKIVELKLSDKDSISSFLDMVKPNNEWALSDRNYEGFEWEVYYYDDNDRVFYHLEIETNKDYCKIELQDALGESYVYTNIKALNFLKKFHVPLYENQY